MIRHFCNYVVLRVKRVDYIMFFNFFSSCWYSFMTSSWKYWDTISAGNDSEIFSNNNTQLKMHSQFFILFVLLQFIHDTILSPGTVATGLPHLSFVHAASMVRLVPTNSGQHIFVFNLIFISSSWSMYFLITSSDKIGISSISSHTIAVVLGVVDNFLPKKFFRFKLWNLHFLPSSIYCSNSPHILCVSHWCGQIKLPHVDYWFYQVIEWFSFQVEILPTPLYQIFLNFVL